MTDENRREAPVERYLLAQCRRHGFLCMKFVSPSRGGVPDRIVVTPSAGTVFVEVKRPGGRPEPRQRKVHAKMRRFGAEIFVVDDDASVDALIAYLLHPPTTSHRKAS